MQPLCDQVGVPEDAAGGDPRDLVGGGLVTQEAAGYGPTRMPVGVSGTAFLAWPLVARG